MGLPRFTHARTSYKILTKNSLTNANESTIIEPAAWRVVRVVEGAALEMLCTKVPRVRIPNSPPKNNRNLDTRLRLFSFCGIMK